ncbi:transporter substrate-binding domain-containing protein [Streptomyces puniciscabiei]
MSVKRFLSVLAACSVAASALAGCGGTDAPQKADGLSLPKDQSLHDALPAQVKKSGTLLVVMTGVNPPWWSGQEGQYTGAAADLSRLMGSVLGMNVKFVAEADISAAIASVASGRYQMAFGPYGDSSGQAGGRRGVDFVDVVQEVVPFLVPKGNPKNIQKLEGLCGVKVAAQVNGGAYKLLQAQAAKCKAAGSSALKVIGQTGVPNGVLAVQSGRADAFFSAGAALFYYARQKPQALEVVGTASTNGFPNLYQGIVMPKGGAMTPVLLSAFKKVFDSGEYKKIMLKYGLEKEMLDQPGIDLAESAQ